MVFLQVFADTLSPPLSQSSELKDINKFGIAIQNFWQKRIFLLEGCFLRLKLLPPIVRALPDAHRSRKRLNDFVERHPEAKASLARWYQLTKEEKFADLVELRKVFPSADQVGKLTVFNVGGNKVRLIAAIHYNRRKIYIRAVLTHSEYDQQRWKE